MRIPFCPLPVNRAKIVSRRFHGIAEVIARVSPSLKVELRQAEFGLDEREYLSIAVFTSLVFSLAAFSALYLVTMSSDRGLSVSITVSSFLLFAMLVYLRKYPGLVVQRKVGDVEKYLLHSLRHIYVQVKSGVPIFDALASVSESNYGLVSAEFKRAVKEINTGKNMEAVLEELAMKNPSTYFRRAVWQLSNGIKAGSDTSKVLKDIISEISAEQRILIRRYGSALNPLTMVYMMVAVILPSMGVTFLIVLSTFSGLSVGEGMFWMIIAFLTIFQFMFLGLMRSRRPNII